MTIESWPVTDRESWLKRREKDVTASVAAALFGDGVHPYITAYELYCLKAGLIEADPEETPAMRRTAPVTAAWATPTRSAPTT